jgi:hypothetical protein
MVGAGYRRALVDPFLPLNFANLEWPVLLALPTIALQPILIPRLRKPNSVHTDATDCSCFNRS